MSPECIDCVKRHLKLRVTEENKLKVEIIRLRTIIATVCDGLDCWGFDPFIRGEDTAKDILQEGLEERVPCILLNPENPFEEV